MGAASQSREEILAELKDTRRRLAALENSMESGQTDLRDKQTALHLLLAVTASPVDLRQSLERAVGILHEWSGCDSVGVRLGSGRDYPYFVASGFSPRFVEQESNLCSRLPDGRLASGPDGSPLLECACGAIIHGRTQPYQPWLSPGGSFWTNQASEVAAEMERTGRTPGLTRGRCLAEGYQSIALVPLCHGGQTLGLLQFNDHRPDRFSAELIELLEGLARGLAQLVALHRERESLAQSQAVLDLALDGLEDVVAILRPDRSVVRLNRAGWRLCGRLPEPLDGRKCYQLMGRGEPCHECVMDEVRTSGAPVERECVMTDRQRQYLCRGYPLLDGSGRLSLVLEHLTDVTERKQAEMETREALEHKEVLLREIHHRVKNNMQVLSSLLNLQAHLCQDPTAAKALADSQGRVKAMGLVHQLLHQSQDLELVDLAAYLQRLAEAKLQSWLPGAQKVRLETNLEPARVEVGRAMHCGLAVNELIANALEHAFGEDQSGRLKMSLRRGEQEARVEVADDGPGLPQGLNPKNTGTLGLQLVQGLVESQLQGRLEVVSRPGDTRFTLSFPLS
jgi:two-component sensor histidine kinase/GAF domain-containing protein